MGTLTAHLRQSEDHGRLRFHPDCPVCRAERLSGTLAQGPVARRTHAAVVAAMLAASSAAPSVAVAQEADQVTEGVAPEQSGTDPAENPDFDPGGAGEDLPYDAPDEVSETPAPAPEADTQGPLEAEPVVDGDVPDADADDGATPAPDAAPAPPPAATAAPAPPSAAALEHTPAAGEPKLELVAQGRGTSKRNEPATAPASGGNQVASTAITEQEVQGDSAADEVERSVPKASVERGATTAGERYHIVRPGESLWSIARDVIGPDASPAQIAREVNVLWQRNSARIATGDPDLLKVGTRLTLR
jgi:LysM domain